MSLTVKSASGSLAPLPDFAIFEFIAEQIENLVQGIVLILNTAVDVLRAVAVFLFDILNPLAVLIDQIIQDLTDFIQGLKDAKVGVTWALPSLDNLISTEEAISKIRQSLDDQFDRNRPITAEGTEVAVAMALFVPRVNGGPEDIERLIELVKNLIDIDPFLDLEEKIAFNQPPPPVLKGQSQAPDWISYKLTDAIPVIGDFVAAAEELLGLLKFNVSYSEIVNKLIAIIEQKAALLQQLSDLLSGALEGFASLALLTFNAILITGTGTLDDLRYAVQAASTLVSTVNEPAASTATVNVISPDPDPQEGLNSPARERPDRDSLSEADLRLGRSLANIDNIGACVALVAVGPDVTPLLTLFGALS